MALAAVNHLNAIDASRLSAYSSSVGAVGGTSASDKSAKQTVTPFHGSFICDFAFPSTNSLILRLALGGRLIPRKQGKADQINICLRSSLPENELKFLAGTMSAGFFASGVLMLE